MLNITRKKKDKIMSNQEAKNYVASIHNAFSGAIGEELKFLTDKRDATNVPVEIAMYTRAIADLKLRVVEAALPVAARMMTPNEPVDSGKGDVVELDRNDLRADLLKKIKSATGGQQGDDEWIDKECDNIPKATEGSK